MKFIITENQSLRIGGVINESQFIDLFFKRRFVRIDELVDKMMRYYPPCDYTYDPYYAFFDYYGDVRNSVIRIVIEDVGLSWEDEDMDKIDDLSESMDEWMHEVFFDKVKEYFDKVIGEGCDE
jgi:hypothetical protein